MEEGNEPTLEEKRRAILEGQKVHLAEGHFTHSISGLLTTLIYELGGGCTTERSEADIVIHNPISVAAQTEKRKIAALLKAHPGLTQTHVPYVWLSLCHQYAKRCEKDGPLLKSPFFVKDTQPIRAWVSVNVHRLLPDETPEAAHQLTADALVIGGALIVKKRAQADILVVDYNSKFYTTVRAEMQKHNREQEQKAVEREWVNDCAIQRKVNWASVDELEKVKAEAEHEGEDSFGEEGTPARKGPGRPPGGRNDYTPQDDDFLARWLAAYSPHGSWSSRKTYETLVEFSYKFPIAAGHSYQSWHERYRKQQAGLKNRIAYFMSAGIDHSLMTEKERSKIAEEAAASSAAAIAAVAARTGREQGAAAADPATVATASEAPPNITNANGKRSLVSLDSDSESPPDKAAAPAIAKTQNAKSPAAADPTAGSSTNTMNIDAPPPTQSPAALLPATSSQSQPATQATSAPSQPPSNLTADSRRSQPLQGDSITVDASLNIGPELTPAERTKPPQVDPQQLPQSQLSNVSDGSQDLLAGLETQAIMSDFVRLQAIAVASKKAAAEPATTFEAAMETSRTEAALPATAVDAIRAESSAQARALSLPHSPQARAEYALPPAKRPRHSEPAQHSSTRYDIPVPTSTTRAPRISHTNDGSGRQRINIPVRVAFNVVGVTQDGSTEEEGEEEHRHRRTHRTSLKGDDFGTPSLHRDLVQKQIASSVSGSSRRRSRRSYGSSRRQQSPDTVYASPAVPPALVRAPVDSPSINAARDNRRQSTPPVINTQTAILHGQEIAKKHADEYKERIRRLSNKYEATPVEVYKALDSTKAPGEVKLPWDEIERRLDAYYQYAG